MNPSEPNENIFTRISNGYFRFTTAEKKVSDFILANKTRVQYISISELAEECGVADATITRFCRRLKLQGYTAFKLALAKAVAETQNSTMPEPPGIQSVPETAALSDPISDLARNCRNIQVEAIFQGMSVLQPESVTRAVDLLEKARRVICMGQGGSMIMAMEAAHLFSNVSTRFVAVQDSHLQLRTIALLDREDAVLFFSYSGSTKEIVELMDLAHTRGAAVILVTRFARSPGVERADVVLLCGSNEGPLQLSSVPAQIAQMYVMDVLYHEFIRRNPELAARRQESIAEALAVRHL